MRSENRRLWLTIHALIFAYLASFGDAVSNAQNTGFVPGDAFFCSRIHEDYLGDVDVGGVAFNESGLFREGTFGGYNGFHRLLVERPQETIQGQLRLAIGKLRTGEVPYDRVVKITERPPGNVVSKEVSDFLLLVYNLDFDATSRPIGLRYNEKWIEKKNGGQFAYNCEWESRDAVIEDWKSASLTAGLKVKYEADFDFTVAAGERSRHTPKIAAVSSKLIVVPTPFFRRNFSLYRDSIQAIDSSEPFNNEAFQAGLTSQDPDELYLAWCEITSHSVELIEVCGGQAKRTLLNAKEVGNDPTVPQKNE